MIQKKHEHGMVALAFTEAGWQLSFAASTGQVETVPVYIGDDDKGYDVIIGLIGDFFTENEFIWHRVLLLYSPPESSRIFPLLYSTYPPVIVVHPERLELHRKRLSITVANKAEFLVRAAISGLTTDLLLIETTNACTFSCLFCPQDKMTRKKERMPFEVAEKIVNDYAAGGVGGIAFHLMGEPTSNPYLPRLVKMVAELKIDHTLTTNASTLTPEMSVELFESGLGRAQISVQTFGKQQFYLYKRPAPKYSYEDVLGNIENFIIAKWTYAPNAEIEIHVMDTSLYQPRGVNIVNSDEEAKLVIEFWRDFLIAAANKMGDKSIAEQISKNSDVRLALDNTSHVNFFFEPTISLKFKMAGHWVQEFLEDDEVILTAKKGTCQQIANGGNNQLAILSSGDAVLCCFDYDGGTRIGSVMDGSLAEIDTKANTFRKQLIESTNLPFKICRRCLGLRVKWFSMGRYEPCTSKELFFENITIYGSTATALSAFDRFKQAGLPHLSFLLDPHAGEPPGSIENKQLYDFSALPDVVEAIIFPVDWCGGLDLVDSLQKLYPEKFIGQLDLVALNPFDREKIHLFRKNKCVESDTDFKQLNNLPRISLFDKLRCSIAHFFGR